jgi:hypothetical protein
MLVTLPLAIQSTAPLLVYQSDVVFWQPASLQALSSCRPSVRKHYNLTGEPRAPFQLQIRTRTSVRIPKVL